MPNETKKSPLSALLIAIGIVLVVLALAFGVFLFAMFIKLKQVAQEVDLSELENTWTESIGSETVPLDAISNSFGSFTPEQINCAYEKIGSERIAEMMNGAEPDMSEMLKALQCLE